MIKQFHSISYNVTNKIRQDIQMKTILKSALVNGEAQVDDNAFNN